MPRTLSKIAVVDSETKMWVRALLRSEMTRRHVTYRDLAQRLTAMGLEENESNLRSKIARGALAASTLLAALHQMDCKMVSIHDLPELCRRK